MYMHNCKKPEEQAAALQPSGFTKDRIPKILSGTLELVQWDGLTLQEANANHNLNSSVQGEHKLRVQKQTKHGHH